MSKVRQRVRTLCLVSGLLLVGFLVWKMGIGEVYFHVSRVGWGILPVLCVSVIWKCNNTVAWMLAFPPDADRPGFWRLFVVNLSGDVVNNLLPTANLGGELAIPYLLKSRMPMSSSIPPVLANKTMEFLSGVLFAALGVWAALLSLPLDGWIRIGLTVGVLTGSVVIGLVCLGQRNGLHLRLYDLLDRLRIGRRFLASRREAIVRVDEGLAAFYGTYWGRFLGCLGLRFGGWILGTLETFLILRLMGVEAAFLAAFLLVALPLMINTVFFFVPANVGTSEAGHAYFSFLLGLNPAVGLSLALVKRFRRLLWMGVGMVLLSAHIDKMR